jgi:hypothetical protein
LRLNLKSEKFVRKSLDRQPPPSKLSNSLAPTTNGLLAFSKEGLLPLLLGNRSMPRPNDLLDKGTHSLVLLSITLVAATIAQKPAAAASELLAVTGHLQPGSTSIQLLGVSAATLNEAGEVAFRATLQQGVGPVDATNDRAIWSIDGSVRALIAQAGVGGAPGGGSFDAFQAASIGDAGEVVIRATTTSGRVGIWRYPPSPGSGSMIAGTGATGAPGAPSAQYGSI